MAVAILLWWDSDVIPPDTPFLGECVRAPRALIPLVSICAAAAVVAAAATGASIEGLSGDDGPAHADIAATSAPSEATINAMTWNVCGGTEPECPLGDDPAALARQVTQRMHATEVGGRTVRTNAVLLQEVCEGHLRGFKKTGWLTSWTWAFAASPGGPSCAKGQGRAGVAIGTEAPLTETQPSKLPAPSGQTRVALCGEVATWATRVCVTQFSPPEDAGWHRRQAAALASLAGTGRVLVGGDLTAAPDNPVLDELYRRFAECDQSGPARTGARTRQNWEGTAVQKSDYLFINESAAVSCSVPGTRTKASDHRPVSAVIRFGERDRDPRG